MRLKTVKHRNVDYQLTLLFILVNVKAFESSLIRNLYQWMINSAYDRIVMYKH